MTKEMTVIARAKKALAPVANEQALQELAGKYTDLTEIKDNTDLKMAKGAQSEFRTVRVNITKTGKEARDDANAFCRAVIAEEKRLVGIIEPEESRIKKLRDDYEAEQERIKAEKERIERERVAAIAKRIAEFETGYNHLMASGAIQARITELDAIKVDDSFAEFKEQAETALTNAKEAAAAALDAAIEREQQEAEAEAKRKAEEEARRAEAERLEKQRQEQARQAELLRQQQEAIERQQAAAQAALDAAKREQERAEIAAQERQHMEEERKAEQARQEAINKAGRALPGFSLGAHARLAAMTLQERIGVWAKSHGIEQAALNELLGIIEQYTERVS